jgi:hypothetical protein
MIAAFALATVWPTPKPPRVHTPTHTRTRFIHTLAHAHARHGCAAAGVASGVRLCSTHFLGQRDELHDAIAASNAQHRPVGVHAHVVHLSSAQRRAAAGGVTATSAQGGAKCGTVTCNKTKQRSTFVEIPTGRAAPHARTRQHGTGVTAQVWLSGSATPTSGTEWKVQLCPARLHATVCGCVCVSALRKCAPLKAFSWSWHVHTDAKARTHHTPAVLPRGFAGRPFEAYHRRVEHLVGTFRRLGLDVMLGQNSADPATRGALRWCQLSVFHVKAIGYSCTVQCNICSRCNSQSMRRGGHAVQKPTPA